MSETIWLTSDDPYPLLDLLTEQASPRKLRLFACACCRQIENSLAPSLRKRIDLCESFADGSASRRALEHSESILLRKQRRAQHTLLHQGPGPNPLRGEAILGALRQLSGGPAYQVAVNTVRDLNLARWHGGLSTARAAVTANHAYQANLLRDIFGNPFRPVPIGPAPNDAIRRLSQLIYDERRFDHLPILADALEEAGCTSESVLGHCRSAGPHVRGCWVVDALLGKC